MNTMKIIGSSLYQWEKGRQLQIFPLLNNTVSYVHFSNPGDREALVVKTKEENGVFVADIPNILLQSGANVVVYAVNISGESVETLVDCTFPVRKRAKPADYVYTETEVLNYAYLDKRLKDLEGEGLANAVAEYLKENPPAAGATAEEVAQIEQNRTDIATLDRTKLAASELPNAVNEALAQAKASGVFNGKDYVLTEADKQEIAEQAAGMVEVPEGGTVTDEQIASAVEDYMVENPVDGDGWPTRAKNLLITILRNGVYSTDQSANITALENAIVGNGEEPDVPVVPDEPVVTTYTITAELVNVASDNAATSVNENASYTATLTAADGYVLDSVTVTMGGVDVTADVYADGVISIPAVTGNVEIVASAIEEEKTAELPTDGLLGYWDFRNPAEVVAKDWHWAYPSNDGDGGLYASVVGGSKGDKSLPTFSDYGTTTGFSLMRDAETYPTGVDFGTEFTFVILTHGEAPTHSPTDYVNGIVGSNINPHWRFGTNYYKADGAMVATGEKGSGNRDNVSDYNFLVKRVNGSDLKIIMDTSEYIFDGADYADFDHWNPYVSVVTLYNKGTTIAVAMYDRVLTDVEIEEMRAFMKTLEVTA